MFSAFLHYKSVEAEPWLSDKSSKLQTRLTIRTLGTSSGIRTASGSIGRDEKNENWNYQQFFNLTVLSCPLSTIRPTQLRTHGHRTHVRTESCSFVAHRSSSSDQDPRKMVACRALSSCWTNRYPIPILKGPFSILDSHKLGGTQLLRNTKVKEFVV